jgi:hypothetical protein
MSTPVADSSSNPSSSGVHNPGRKIKAEKPAPAPAVAPEVQPERLFFEGRPCTRIQVVLSHDVPVFVEGVSSFTERNLDMQAVESQGAYTRPVALRAAKTIECASDGRLRITWQNGKLSFINALTVASFAISF